jgi:hypothetical protein
VSPPTVTELLDLVLQAERLRQFAEAREHLRRVTNLDGGQCERTGGVPLVEATERIIA